MAHRANNLQVVTDEEVCQTIFALQITQKLNDLDLNGHIERTGRLIEHHQFRAQNHCASNRDTLSLATRKLVRIPVHHGRVQTNLCHHLGNQFPLIPTGVDLVNCQTFRNDLSNRHPRAQTAVGILKHDLHVTPQGAQCLGRQALDILALESDRTFRRQQSHDRKRQRRFAGTRFANNSYGLACAHSQTGRIHRFHMTNRTAQKTRLNGKPDPKVICCNDFIRVIRHVFRGTAWVRRQQLLCVGMLRVGKDL